MTVSLYLAPNLPMNPFLTFWLDNDSYGGTLTVATGTVVSLVNKLKHFQGFVYFHSLDVIALTET